MMHDGLLVEGKRGEWGGCVCCKKKVLNAETCDLGGKK